MKGPAADRRQDLGRRRQDSLQPRTQSAGQHGDIDVGDLHQAATILNGLAVSGLGTGRNPLESPFSSNARRSRVRVISSMCRRVSIPYFSVTMLRYLGSPKYSWNAVSRKRSTSAAVTFSVGRGLQS